MRFALLLALLVPFLPAQTKLESRQRDAISRQETSLGNLERALAKGNTTLTMVANWKNTLASLRNELQRHAVPADHPQSVALMEKVTAFETRMAAAETVAAAASWANVDKAFADLEAQIERVQAERELARIQKKLDEIAAFAATRPDDAQAKMAGERAAAIVARGKELLGGQQAAAERLATLTDPKSYPTLDKDLTELDGVFDRFRSFGDIRRDPQKTAEMCNQWKPAAEYHAHCLQTYKELLTTSSQLGKDVKAHIQRTGEVLILFRDKAVEFQNAAPGAVREALTKAAEFAQTGKAEQKPGYFTGGVKQQLDSARGWLAAYAAIRGESDAEVTTLRGEIETATATTEAMASTLKEQILAEARPPEDVYRGVDRAALEQKIRAAWTKKYPKDEVLAVRFHMEAWKRDQSSTWYPTSKSWQHTDTSVLCVTFVIRTSETIATTYPAYLNKDHLSQDTITTGVDTKGSSYASNTMLVKNLGAAAAPR